MRLTAADVTQACGGVFTHLAKAEEIIIGGVSTDSRKPMAGCLFAAIPGDKFDGHDFIPQAAAQGAVCALAEREAAGAGIPVIRVPSVREALLDLAAYYRAQFPVSVVAVTGSVGKTTTKDMIAHMLAQCFRVKKTEGNFNNEIGLPLTVFQLEKGDQALVLEMGMNHLGEISALSRAAKPNLAVITQIGDAHIENLGSREGILNAKLEIVDGMKDGMLIINGDDPLLSGLKNTAGFPCFVYTCGLNEGEVSASDIRTHGLYGTDFILHIEGRQQPVHTPAPGSFMVTNALLAAAAGTAFDMSIAEIAAGIESFKPVSANRMVITETNGMTVVNDVYNASPASVRAAVDALADTEAAGRRRVCVLGDMYELGGRAPEFHREMGRYAAQKGMDLLVAVGKLARFMSEEYVKAGGKNALWFDNKPSFISIWRKVLREKDLVLVKASRAMQFEDIVEAFHN